MGRGILGLLCLVASGKGEQVTRAFFGGGGGDLLPGHLLLLGLLGGTSY